MSCKLDIVVHCWAADLPQYAAMLRVQAKAIVDYAPANSLIHYRVGVASPEHDPHTWEVLKQIIDERTMLTLYGGNDHILYLSPNVVLNIHTLPRERLFRRAIFRDWCIRHGGPDVFWLADVDYAPLEGCLAAILAQVQNDSGLCFPREYAVHLDHAVGDQHWQDILAGKIPEIDASQFKTRPTKTAIGGVQIIGSQYAKRIGYLGGEGSKWQKPEETTVPFRCFRDDSTWRRLKFPDGGRIIDVPNLYRQRHSIGAAGSPGPKKR